MESYAAFLDVTAKVLLGLGVFTGVICIVDWAIRARHISPFNPLARFFRTRIDPLLRPLETIIVRRGGQPQNAPFFAFMVVIVAGIVILQLLRMFGGVMAQVQVGVSSPGRFVMMLIGWMLDFLTFALLVRVVSSWLPVSPYSKWIRWSYASTDWILLPLRRVIPPFGQIDITPIVAYLILRVAGSVLGV